MNGTIDRNANWCSRERTKTSLAAARGFALGAALLGAGLLGPAEARAQGADPGWVGNPGESSDNMACDETKGELARNDRVRVLFRDDGNLVVADHDHSILWESGTDGHPDAAICTRDSYGIYDIRGSGGHHTAKGKGPARHFGSRAGAVTQVPRLASRPLP